MLRPNTKSKISKTKYAYDLIKEEIKSLLLFLIKEKHC
jgi:hypothetical protein